MEQARQQPDEDSSSRTQRRVSIWAFAALAVSFFPLLILCLRFLSSNSTLLRRLPVLDYHLYFQGPRIFGVSVAIALVFALAVRMWLRYRAESLRGAALAVTAFYLSVFCVLISLSPWSPWYGSRNYMTRQICRSNLRQIGMAILQARQDEWNKSSRAAGMTESLSALSSLYPAYVTSLRLFLCPADELGRSLFYVSKTSWPLTESTCSYKYETDLPPQLGPGTILAYDRSAAFHSGEGRNVLFGDGHVEWMAEPDFQQSLTRQRATVSRKSKPTASPRSVSAERASLWALVRHTLREFELAENANAH